MAGASSKRKRAQGHEFSAKEMFEALDRGPPRIITCAVKKSDTDETVVLVSQDKTCTNWLAVPESQIERYVYVGQMLCSDHNHAVVTLYLHPPKTDEGELFLLATQPGITNLASASGPHQDRSIGEGLASSLAATGWPSAPSLTNFSGLVAGGQAGFFQPKGPCIYDWRYGYVYPGTTTPCP